MEDSQIPRDGRLFGKYTLIAKLASGGMGEIYLARLDGVAGFEKIVVIKRVLPHLASSQKYVVMLLDEARIAARLSHPNICQVYELGEVDGEYYIAMEYLEGIAMLELFRRMAKQKQHLSPRLVASIIAQACEGLHAAHELLDRNGDPTNLVHRDISPSNIFVTAAGAVKILDFGIAKTPDRQATTRTGMIKGKWSYMSPEQTLGQVLDRRSDIFSLGIVLFEGLTMRRLYARQSEYLTCRAITEFDAPAIRRYRAELPEALERVVEMALARQRERRFATAREMSKALTKSVGQLGGPASLSEISELVDEHFKGELDERRVFVQRVGNRDSGGAQIMDFPGLPIVPYSPADTSIASSPGMEAIQDEIPTQLLSGSGSHALPLMYGDDGGDSDSRREPTNRPTARASGLELPLVSPPTQTAEAMSLDPASLAALGLSTQVSEEIPLSQPRSERAATPIPGAQLQSGQPPSSQAPAGYDTTLRVPKARAGGNKLLLFLVVILVAGAGAAGAYFGLRAPRTEKAPQVTVYDNSADEDDEDAGSDDGSNDGSDAGPVPDAAAKKPKTRPNRKPKGDRYSRAISRSRRKLSSCLRKHAAAVQGTPSVKIKVQIAKSGKVTALSLQPSSVASTDLGKCVTKVVKGINFGRHKEAVEATIPLAIKRSR